MKQIKIYTSKDNKSPFLEWRNELSSSFKIRIDKRLQRMREGLYGDWKKLQNSSLSELRFDFGKGYRIYFKEIDNIIILILAGSSKSDQKAVIKKAEEYLEDYLNREYKQ